MPYQCLFRISMCTQWWLSMWPVHTLKDAYQCLFRISMCTRWWLSMCALTYTEGCHINVCSGYQCVLSDGYPCAPLHTLKDAISMCVQDINVYSVMAIHVRPYIHWRMHIKVCSGYQCVLSDGYPCAPLHTLKDAYQCLFRISMCTQWWISMCALTYTEGCISKFVQDINVYSVMDIHVRPYIHWRIHINACSGYQCVLSDGYPCAPLHTLKDAYQSLFRISMCTQWWISMCALTYTEGCISMFVQDINVYSVMDIHVRPYIHWRMHIKVCSGYQCVLSDGYPCAPLHTLKDAISMFVQDINVYSVMAIHVRPYIHWRMHIKVCSGYQCVLSDGYPCAPLHTLKDVISMFVYDINMLSLMTTHVGSYIHWRMPYQYVFMRSMRTPW